MASLLEPNDATTKVVAETQLKSYVDFMSRFSSQLTSIENAIGCIANTNKDKRLHPITVQTKAEEKLSLIDVITTENKILNKVLITFCALCNEVVQLEDEAKCKFYNQLLFYGETGKLDESDEAEMSPHEQISRILPLLQHLLCFVQRSREVLKNTIQQMAALYNKSFPQVIDVSQVHFSVIFQHLAILLRVLLTIDEIVANNSILQDHWNIYKGVMKSVRLNPAGFDVPPDKVVQMEKLVRKIDNLIISSRLTMHCMEQDFDDSGIPVSKNTLFIDEFVINMRYLLSRLEPKLGENVCETQHAIDFVSLSCLFALQSRIFHDVNKKLFRQIWDMSKKLPCVVLIGPVTWFVEKFFTDFLPAKLQTIDAKSRDQCLQNRKNYLSGKIEALQREFQYYFFAVNNWLVTMTSSSGASQSLDDLTSRLKMYLEGMSLGGRMRRTMENLLNLHVTLNKPMSVNVVLLICRFVSIIKSINDCYYRYSNQTTQNSIHILQRIQYQILNNVEAIKKKLISDKRYSNRRLDMLSALVLFSNNIDAVPTTQRLLVAKLSLALANQSKLLRDEEYLHILTQIDQLSILSHTVNYAMQTTQLSAFYWHRGVLDHYFQNLHKETYDATDLHFMLAAVEDCVPCLKSTLHFKSCQILVDNFRQDILSMFKQQFLEKLYKNVENDLRLSVHTHLKLDDRNPFRVGIKSLRQALSLNSINFMGEFVDIKALTTHYLDQTFYNLTTVALHDWKTYGDMRKVATNRYQLKMQEVHLPNQQLEQGLDVLEIMRNIHVFVPKYLYNLSNQVFVEKWSNNKHLNTINIQHIANSIRTHGTGIINTTVNFTFQFLKKKFFIFSQFLFDEHIKSRLVKDIREFRSNCESLKHQYPYESAERFNRGIRKLGVAEDGSSFLDQFRVLITQIGNAMGYIRMVRTGGLHFCSDAISFVPDLEEIINFEELAKADEISEEVNSSFAQFDSSIGRLAKNVGEGSDYFRMLVDVFAPEFRNTKNMHLLNFYAIVPALTINFVEHVIICKEKMNKKNKIGAAFTDDGFAMGLAYILKLLDQNSQFDALHWFNSVTRKYATDAQGQQQSNKQTASNDYDDSEKLLQTKELALKRIVLYRREFDLLYYSLSSARIFFRAGSSRSDADNKTNEETTSSGGNNDGGEAKEAETEEK